MLRLRVKEILEEQGKSKYRAVLAPSCRATPSAVARLSGQQLPFVSYHAP